MLECMGTEESTCTVLECCREGLRNFQSLLEEEGKGTFCEQKERQEKGKSLDLHCHEFNNLAIV